MCFIQFFSQSSQTNTKAEIIVISFLTMRKSKQILSNFIPKVTEFILGKTGILSTIQFYFSKALPLLSELKLLIMPLTQAHNLAPAFVSTYI